MNKKQMRRIRQAMKNEPEAGDAFIAHPLVYTNDHGTWVKYSFQYVKKGQKQLIKLAKKIYKLSGVLPRRNNV